MRLQYNNKMVNRFLAWTLVFSIIIVIAIISIVIWQAKESFTCAVPPTSAPVITATGTTATSTTTASPTTTGTTATSTTTASPTTTGTTSVPTPTTTTSPTAISPIVTASTTATNIAPVKQYAFTLASDKSETLIETPSSNPYKLTFVNGDLRILNQSDPKLIWKSGTAGFKGAKLTMQSDGNLVIYCQYLLTANPIWVPIWSTRTFNNPGATMRFDEQIGMIEIVKDGAIVKRIPEFTILRDKDISSVDTEYIKYGNTTDNAIRAACLNDYRCAAVNSNGYGKKLPMIGNLPIKDSPGITLYLKDWGMTDQGKRFVYFWQGADMTDVNIVHEDLRFAFENGALKIIDKGVVVWKTPTLGEGTHAQITTDGNLIIKNDKEIIWSSNTGGFDIAMARWDGNLRSLTLCKIDGTVVRAFGPNGYDKLFNETTFLYEIQEISGSANVVSSINVPDKAKLYIGNGNITIKSRGDEIIFNSGTSSGDKDWKLVPQGDNNLVMYKKDGDNWVAIWASGTAGTRTVPFFNARYGSIDFINNNTLITRIGGYTIVDYFAVPNKDVAANDITRIENSTLDQLKAKCSELMNCVAFNNNGYLKSSATMVDSANSTTYVKTKRTRFPYAHKPKKDVPGNDITRIDGSFDDIRRECDLHPDCKGFNTSGYLKGNIGDLVDSDQDMFIKEDAVLYDRYEDKDVYGSDIIQVQGSISEIRQACDSNPDCNAFNGRGWLKNVGPNPNMIDAKGYTLYVKNAASPQFHI